MKLKLFFFVFLSALSLTVFAQQKTVEQGYVDLGLPSGTIWKRTNAAGFYTYDQAVYKFGNQLPSMEQWEELKNECDWTWTGNGYKVTGPNGNSITMPAAGSQDCDGNVGARSTHGDCWASTPYNSEYAWSLFINSEIVLVTFTRGCSQLSVRLVQN